MIQWSRFRTSDGRLGFGVIVDERIVECDGDFYTGPRPTAVSFALDEVTLLSPCTPSKIVALWNNFHALAAKLAKPVPRHPLFLIKPGSSVAGPGEAITRPAGYGGKIAFEGELGIVIGKPCKDVAESEAADYILGYTCVNDVTARDLQTKDGQWSRAKGFDTFCPVGPLVTDEIDPWKGVAVGVRVNNDVRQDGNTRDFIFALDVVIRHIAQAMTLFPGDLIATGTPSGVSPIVAGDVVEVSVAGVGVLRNLVADE